MEPILALDRLSKSIPESGRSLFANVSAQVAAGDRIAVLGASGQGKSTLLKVLSLLVGADRGDIRLEGKSFEQWEPKDWRSKVVYFSQQPYMLPGTIESNMTAVSRLHRREFDRRLAEELLSKLGLGRLDWSKEAETLSGGEKQRVALARGLLLKPDILLLDETTASLDANSKALAEETLLEWHRREGSAAIWVTHDPEQARRMSERIWFLSDGKLQEDTAAESFFEHPVTAAARAYLRLPEGGPSSCP
ncbi:ABC transporter ATP-binding protein [Cohnella zeiphila]|uniref:ATP-binding cassette domain-containing protein n=1 Tax=Cohnella zeiphila TaxID=2761120 RepID=A0A7X0VWW5_9BACL|nr:ATP-binding cassette domain-containing protein [Cohnella zeiphila]MBB6733659.1 ATP-binding cassette domain-containing protein [Cohnella zeiphila]